VGDLPLLRRFPSLTALPRANFGDFPTPVERVALSQGATLLVKRDDRSGAAIGGNKVRALEWLLGGVRDGDHIVTVGPRGSTHALATARCARLRGAHTTVVRWDQVMNAAAERVDLRLRQEAHVLDARVVPVAYARSWAIRLRGNTRWIPAGGSTPLGILGHVNAGLELAGQIARGECETPDRIHVPFGTGGTAAGIALGLRLANLDIPVVAVRVAPRILANRRRLHRLAAAASRFIERHEKARLPRVRRSDLVVEHRFYGGAYGQPLPRPSDADRELRRSGIHLDDTYSAKAFASAISERSRRPLLWLTFDGRLLQD
jgi:1-aminocyclopropane-1-carboxylate deaminase/D-cysteine desulfhydrase-like pyridoxal-dependent ACC family enzyme